MVFCYSNPRKLLQSVSFWEKKGNFSLKPSVALCSRACNVQTTDVEATRQRGRMRLAVELPATGAQGGSPSETGCARQLSPIIPRPIAAPPSHIAHSPPKNRSGDGDRPLGDVTGGDGCQTQGHTRPVHCSKAQIPPRLTCVRGRGMQPLGPPMQVLGQQEALF